MNKNQIKPIGLNLVAEVTELPNIENGIYTGPSKFATRTKVEYYYGKATMLGSNTKEKCPELKEGDNIIFNQFAGYLAPTTDAYVKVIRSHDVVAIVNTSFDKMEEKNIKPTGERILVKIIGEDLVDANGIFNDSKPDPRDADTQKAVVLSCAKGALVKFPKGTIVAFDPYCGNLILNAADCKLKTIHYDDILFTIDK